MDEPPLRLPFKPTFIATGDMPLPPGETPDDSDPSVAAAEAVPDEVGDDVGELLRFRLLPPTLELALPPLR